MAYTIIATQHSQASNGTLSRVNNKFLTVEGSNLTAKEIKTAINLTYPKTPVTIVSDSLSFDGVDSLTDTEVVTHTKLVYVVTTHA